MTGPLKNLIVKIGQGILKGGLSKTDNGFQFYSFRGIPYARPMVGELRFSIPQPPLSWEGVKDATKNCNYCIQMDRASKSITGDEDCLFLNVYTPKLPSTESKLLPVMVFIHGGGFLAGRGTDELKYGPDFLIEKDVVVVSFNYRLGILGFLSLDCKDAPGNMGLMDQVQALKWVQQNIASFGGNPDNVTIFGMSAGGASVEYLLLSPMAKGLFNKAISSSGSSLLHWAHNTNIKKLATKIPSFYGKDITDDDQLLKYLKTMPINDLITGSMKALADDEFRGGFHFGFVPTTEKPKDWEPFLSKSPYQLLAQGEFNKIPYMSGFNTKEALLLISHGSLLLDKYLKDKCFVNHFPFELDNEEKIEMELKLKSSYLEPGKSFDTSNAIDFFTDVDILSGVYVAAKLIAKHTPAYFYEFSYDGNQNYMKKSYNIKGEGACHGDESGYLLKNYRLPGPFTSIDNVVCDRMRTMWTNFAKYGNPTPEIDDLITSKWEPIGEAQFACYVIDKETKMKYEMYPQRTKLYEDLYQKKFGRK